MRIGYARVSTEDQKLDLQRDALRAAGCEKTFEEKVSGTCTKLPLRHELLEYARRGDVVVVWKLDRLGRSLRDLVEIVRRLEQRGAELCSLHEAIDTTTAAGKLTFHLFAALAELASSARARANACRSGCRSCSWCQAWAPSRSRRG